MFCKAGNGDLLPDLEAHLKVFRDLIEIPHQLLCSWRPIKCRVITDSTKERFSVVQILAILPQTLPHKRAFGVVSLIDLTLPAFVCPSGGPEPDEGRK